MGCAAAPTAATRYAASRLEGLLAQRGDEDGLRARADAGDGEAASRLPDVLISRAALKKRSSCAGSA